MIVDLYEIELEAKIRMIGRSSDETIPTDRKLYVILSDPKHQAELNLPDSVMPSLKFLSMEELFRLKDFEPGFSEILIAGNISLVPSEIMSTVRMSPGEFKIHYSKAGCIEKRLRELLPNYEWPVDYEDFSDLFEAARQEIHSVVMPIFRTDLKNFVQEIERKHLEIGAKYNLNGKIGYDLGFTIKACVEKVKSSGVNPPTFLLIQLALIAELKKQRGPINVLMLQFISDYSRKEFGIECTKDSLQKCLEVLRKRKDWKKIYPDDSGTIENSAKLNPTPNTRPATGRWWTSPNGSRPSYAPNYRLHDVIPQSPVYNKWQGEEDLDSDLDLNLGFDPDENDPIVPEIVPQKVTEPHDFEIEEKKIDEEMNTEMKDGQTKSLNSLVQEALNDLFGGVPKKLTGQIGTAIISEVAKHSDKELTGSYLGIMLSGIRKEAVENENNPGYKGLRIINLEPEIKGKNEDYVVKAKNAKQAFSLIISHFFSDGIPKVFTGEDKEKVARSMKASGFERDNQQLAVMAYKLRKDGPPQKEGPNKPTGQSAKAQSPAPTVPAKVGENGNDNGDITVIDRDNYQPGPESSLSVNANDIIRYGQLRQNPDVQEYLRTSRLPEVIEILELMNKVGPMFALEAQMISGQMNVEAAKASAINPSI